jgi:hypothetical protein
MKRAKKIKPRNLLATAPQLKKGGRHARKDKHASRARQKAAQRRLSAAEESE